MLLTVRTESECKEQQQNSRSCKLLQLVADYLSSLSRMLFWLQAIVDDPLMRHSAVLVFANKQDLVGLTVSHHSLSESIQTMST